MASPEAVVIRAGEICADCPSAKYLGELSLGQTCEGPKYADMAGEKVPYCGRQPIKSYKEPSLVDQLIRYSGMDE